MKRRPRGLANCVCYNKVLLYGGFFFTYFTIPGEKKIICFILRTLFQIIEVGYIEVSLYDEEKCSPRLRVRADSGVVMLSTRVSNLFQKKN